MTCFSLVAFSLKKPAQWQRGQRFVFLNQPKLSQSLRKKLTMSAIDWYFCE
jgi:hypothetical protein